MSEESLQRPVELLSSAMQDYLKAIFVILEQEDRATTSAIAQRMSVAPASVTAMIKKFPPRRPPTPPFPNKVYKPRG